MQGTEGAMIPLKMSFCPKTWRCFLWLVAAVTMAFASSCQSMKRHAYREQGWASYIADSYEGRPTSSGSFYDPRAFTAAHNTLPFGTVVTVKNEQTGKKVDVIVNDRFPSYPGRVINVSGAAGMELGIPPFQLAPVEVTADQLGPTMGAPSVPGYASGYTGSMSGGSGVPPPIQQGQPNYTRQTMQPIFGGGGSAPPPMGGYNPGMPPPTYPPAPVYPPAGGGVPPAGSGLYPPGGDRGL